MRWALDSVATARSLSSEGIQAAWSRPQLPQIASTKTKRRVSCWRSKDAQTCAWVVQHLAVSGS